MILYIDTTQNNLVEIGIKVKKKFIARKKFGSRLSQAEKLLPAIVQLLKDNKFKPKDIKSIEVINQGGSFTSLRIGVVTANALGYALGIPVSGSQKLKVKSHLSSAVPLSGTKGEKFLVVKPLYNREPEITARNLMVCKQQHIK